jgi:hypothetical protein
VPPQFEGTPVEVIVLSDQFVIKRHRSSSIVFGPAKAGHYVLFGPAEAGHY